MSASGSVGRRSGAFLVSRLIGSAGFFVAVVLLAHGLDPSGRGAIAFVTVTALTVGALVRLGVGDATLVLSARWPARRGVLFSNLVVWTSASAMLGGSAAAVALIIAGEHRPAGIGLGEIAAVAVGTVLSAFVEAGYPMLLASGRVREQATITATGPWVYAALLLTVGLTTGLTVRNAAIAWVISQGVWAASLLVIALRGIGLGKPSAALFKETLAFGLQAGVGSLAFFLNARVDQLLVGVLTSSRSLGVYAVAVNAAEIVLYLPTASAQALLSSVARDDPDVRATRVTRAFRGTVLITGVLAVIGAAVGPFVVPLVFGEPYVVSAIPFLWLLPGAIGFTAISVFSTGLLLSSSPRLASIGPVVALVSGVVLDLALIPILDVTGAALSASVALLAGGAASLVSYRARTGVPIRDFVPGPADVRLLWSFADAARASVLGLVR